MAFLTVAMGLSAVMFASYSIVILRQIYDMYRLRLDYSSIPVKKISALNEKSGYVRINGKVKPVDIHMKSFIDDLDVSYFRLLAIPQKRAFRPFEKRKAVKFYISDETGKILISPEKARFIVNRHSIDGKDVIKNNLSDFLPENFKLENFKIWEEFLENGSKVNLIGDITVAKEGDFLITKQNKPLVISQCSDDAFMLIHFRFLMRLIFLFCSMALTSLVQFYFLFSL